MESAQYDPAPTSDSYLGSEGETELETEEESEGEEETTAETEEELDSSRLTDQNEEDKTKQECIISDPSFSMVTVQREDSGITWETSSSRSSTPWASESSLTSDMYSMAGSTVSSPPGNISFILDEGKKVRKRTRKTSSKHGSPALRRKGGKKRHSLEGQADVPANAKDKASISDGKSEQEKSSIGTYDKNRKKKTVSSTPPITGAIYKEHKPLVLRPVYIGTVQYKIKMFNSVKEEIIPLQFYGTLPKGYVIKEINYRKGKDASITLEPEVTNQDPSIASKTSKPMTQNIDNNKEKQLSPPWREAMSKESRPVPSVLKDIEKPKEIDSYSPLNAAGLKRTVSSYSSNETMAPQSLSLSASTLPDEEASMQEIQMYSPDAATQLMAPKMKKEEFKADMQQAVVSSPTLSMSPSFVDEVGEEERESDLLATAVTSISENLTSTKAEEEAFESDSPVIKASAPGPFGTKVDNLGLSSSEKEEPVSPTGEGEMEETKPESSVSLSESPVLGEMKEKEEGVSLPITSGPELEPSYVSEEEIIEIDYPESPSPSENAIPPHLVHEGEREEAEPDLLPLTTSTSEHVALLEKEREEIGPISPDSDFASEFSSLSYSTHELEEKETKPASPPAVVSASEYEILSEETMPYSPEFTSVSECSTSPTVEEESIGCETPTHLASTPEATIFSEDETLESERYTPDSTSASEYSVPLYASQEQKEETSQHTPLSSVAVAEHMIISEAEKDDIGPFSPDSAFVSEYSFSPHAVRESEKEEFERDYPPRSTSPSEHTIWTEEENEEIEPFSPDSASDFSVLSYTTPEPEKKDSESGSLQTAISVSEYSIFSEAEKEKTETQAPTMPVPEHTILSQRQKAQHSFSVPESEQLNLPPSTAEAEKGEVKPSSQTAAKSVSEYLVLSQKQKIKGLSQVLESEYSIPPSSTEEREKEETQPDSSVPALMKAGSSEKEKLKPVLPETSVTRPQESIPAESTEEVKKELGPELAHAQKGASEHLSFSKVSKEEIMPNSQVTPPEYPDSLQHKEMEPHSPRAPDYVMEPSVAPREGGEKVGKMSIETPVPQQETSLKNKENLKDIQKAKSLTGLGVSQAETKEKIRQDKEQVAVPEFRHLVLSESEKEETAPPPELKFSSLSEENKKEIGPDPPQATLSELKPSLLPKVVKEEIQPDSPLPTTSVMDSVLSKARAAMPESQHLVLSESEKEETAPPPELKFSSLSEENKKEIGPDSPQATLSELKPSLLPKVVKEEIQPDSPLPKTSVLDSVLSEARAAVPESQHLVLSESEKEETAPPPELKFSSLSEENKKEIGPDSPQATLSELKPSLLPKVVKEEIQPDSPLPTTSVLDSVLSEARAAVPESQHLVLSESEKEETAPPPELKFSSLSEENKKEIGPDSPQATLSELKPSLLPKVVKEEIQPDSPLPTTSVLDSVLSEARAAVPESQHLVLSESEKEETAPPPEPKFSSLSEENKKEIGPDSPQATLSELKPSLLPKVVKEEIQPDSPLPATSLLDSVLSEARAAVPESQHLVLSESEKEETAPPPEPKFSSLSEENKKEIGPDSPQATLSELKPSLLPKVVKEEIQPDSPLPTTSVLDSVLSEARAAMPESQHLVLSESEKEETAPPPELKFSSLSEENKKEIGPDSPQATLSELKPSLLPKVVKEEIQPDSPLPTTSVLDSVLSEARAAVPESQHLVLSESEKEETAPPPELKFSSLSEENKKEIGPDSPQATLSELKPSLLPKVVKEEIQPDSPLPTTSVLDSVLSEARAAVPESQHLVSSESEKEETAPPPELKFSSLSEENKKEIGPDSPQATLSELKPSLLPKVVKEEIQPDSPLPTTSVLDSVLSEARAAVPESQHLVLSESEKEETAPPPEPKFSSLSEENKKEIGPDSPQATLSELKPSLLPKVVKEEIQPDSPLPTTSVLDSVLSEARAAVPESQHLVLSESEKEETAPPPELKFSSLSEENKKEIGPDSPQATLPELKPSLLPKVVKEEIQPDSPLPTTSVLDSVLSEARAAVPESQHLVLSESEKEETAPPPELKFSSLSEENKKEIGPDSPQATLSELKPSLLPKVVKEEIQPDSPLPATSVMDSVLSKARKEEVDHSSPPTEHLVLNEKKKEVGEPGPSPIETTASESPIWSEAHKEEVNFHASPNARYSAEHAVLSEVVKEEEKSGSPLPEHSMSSKVGSDQGVPPVTVPAPVTVIAPELFTLSKKQASESSAPASMTEGSVPPYMAVEIEKKDTKLPSSKTVTSASDQGVPSQEKEEIKYHSHELETLETEELSMKSVTPTGERSRQEPGTLISEKSDLPSEKSAAPSSSLPVEPEKTGMLPHALELSGAVSELSQDLVSENEHRDAKLEISLTSETGSSVPERGKSEAKTREEGKQEYKPFSTEVTSMVSDKSVASFMEKENPEPQQEHFSLKEVLQESRNLAGSNKGEKQKGHPLTSPENLAPQGTGDILTKANEDITQTHSFPMSENVPEPSKMTSSDLSEGQAKQKTPLCPDDVDKLPELSIPLLSSPLADQQDIAAKSHSFAEANLPLEKSESIMMIDPGDVMDEKDSHPLQKEGRWLLKEPSQEQASPDAERVLEPCSSATDGRLLGQLTSAPPEKKQTDECIKQESFYPAKEPDLSAEGPTSSLGRPDDHREELTTQTYSSPEVQMAEEPRGTVLVENIARPEANGKQLSSSVDSESVTPEKLGTEEDGHEKFTPTSESSTKVQTQVSGDHIMEQVKPEIIPSSVKATGCLAEDSVTALGSEKEDVESTPYSSTEKRVLKESKADTSKVVENADEAQQSESEKPLPEAKITMQEKSKLSLIQSGEIMAPLDSPEIINKVPEQAEIAAPSTVTNSKAKKGVSSFTSWMASLFFGTSAPENDVDEKEAQPSPAADTAVLEGEVKMTLPGATDDFNETEKPALSPLSVSGLLPEKEPKVILIKASEEREQKETPLTLPNQVDKEPSKLTLLRGEKVSQKSEPLPIHHLPESGLLSEAESRTVLTESGKPRQSKEEPMFLSAVEETPPELSKPISGNLIQEHKIPENRKEEMQPLSGIGVEMPSELASIKVTSAQNRTYLENQPPLLGKQLVSEEAENGAPVHITSDNRVQKAEIYTHSETSQLTEESKSVLTYLDEQHDQEKTLFSSVEVDQVTWSAKSTPSEFASETTMKESAKLQSRTLTMEEPKDSLIKVGDDRPEKEMPKAVSSTLYDDESNLKTISSTDEEKVLEQKPYLITEKAVLAEKSEMAVPLMLRETKEIRMAGLLQESELHKVEYSKESVLQFCENKEDKGMVAMIPVEVSLVSEIPKFAASIPSENQLSSAERGMREDSKPHPVLESRKVSEELGMTLGSSVDESQPLSFTKADFFKESQIALVGPTESNKEESCQSPLAEKEKLILGRSDAITVSLEKEGEQKVSLPNLSPGENNQMAQPYSAGGTNFASEESGITFGIFHDESENLKNQTYSLAKEESVTGESQMVLSVGHPETKETKTGGIQPTSLSENDSLEEKTRTSIPTSPGHRVEVVQEDICALPDIGSLTSKMPSHNEEKEQHLLSSDISHAMAKPSKEVLPGITKESKKQEPQPKLGIFGKLVSRESKITLDHPFDETENLDQLSSFPEAIFSPVKSSAVISVSSPEVNISEISKISPPEVTAASQAHQTKDGAPDSSMPPTFVSKQVSDSQTKPMGDLQVDKSYPSAILDSDHVTCDMPSTNDEEISSTEGIAKEPENLFVKEGAFAAPVVTSKPPGLTEDQKNAFSIISEGCEILNIHAPAFISSVDEEECEKMQDKLEYLEEKTSQSIRPFHDDSKILGQETEMRNESHACHLDVDVSLEKGQMQEKTHLAEEDISTDSDVAFSYHTMPSDVDYFEKYTLIDYNISPEPLKKESFEKQDIEREPQKKVPEETISFPESSADKTLECEFDLVKLDESFYGMEKDDGKVPYIGSQPFLPTLRSTDRETPRDVARDVESKSPGMPLFNEEEGVLSRTQLFPTEVKAVNPELLEEPPAVAFLYKDLYEEAVGDKKKEGETASDRESLNSEASFPSRHSDAEEGTGMYFEKYILKDDILHDASGYQKDQSQPLEEKPVGKDDSCRLIAGEGEVWGRFGTIFGERSMEEEQKAMFSEGELRSSAENHKDGEVQGKMPITEEVQLASQKISYAVPFQDTHHILERVDEPDGQGNEEENASPEASQHFPVEVSYPEEELTSGAMPAPESLQVEPRVFVPAEMTEARPCSSPVQDEYEFAELMNYEVVTQEDLLSDDLFSQSTPEDVLSQGKESFELIGENDEFAKQAEQSKSVLQKDSGSEVVEPERLLAEAEDAQKETKKSQIDTYCYTCKYPISAIDKIFGAHKDHEVAALDAAIDVVKIQLGEFLENLKEKSLKIEAFVTEIESFFNTIEENCSKNEKRLEEQNEEMMKKVLAQYDEKAQSFEEVKRRKMEFLHEQMVNFLQSMDTAKETLETIVKEAEELDETVFLTSFKEINDRLLSAMESTASLENIPTAFSLFEHYDDSSTRSDQMLKHVAVPQPPILEPQEPNSATSTTITVYWSVRKEDVIDSFQVYCMEEPQEDSEANDLVEEYRLTVKESYCLFEDLEPGRCYQVWVMAVNFTGCSLPSERATFKTAPSTPIIKAEECTVCWNTATIRWSSANPGAADAYTLEYCRQHSPEGEGLRSYSGIKGFQLKVNLQPNDNYFFYAKAVNAFGTSEQSEAALISTRGTRFLLLRETAHPALQISSDGTVIRLTERKRLTEIPSVLGEQLPACGQHYWETTVTDCPAYRLGICSSSNTQSSAVGQGDASWYMHCSEPQRYKFFSNGTVSNVHVTEHPVRVGILLDYSNQRLLFINAESGQLLFTIRQRFTGPIHPAFALEKPGQFSLHLGKELPDFLRHK